MMKNVASNLYVCLSESTHQISYPHPNALNALDKFSGLVFKVQKVARLASIGQNQEMAQ